MTITVTDVREALNLISEDELADVTIVQKINDAKAILGAQIKQPVSVQLFEIAIRNYAAYFSFIVSNVFKSAKFGPLSVQRDVQQQAELLRLQAEQSIKNLKITTMKIEKSYLFTHRDIAVPTYAKL